MAQLQPLPTREIRGSRERQDDPEVAEERREKKPGNMLIAPPRGAGSRPFVAAKGRVPPDVGAVNVSRHYIL